MPETSEKGKERDAIDRRQGTKVPKTERIITRAARRISWLQPIENQQDRERRLGQFERFEVDCEGVGGSD